MKAVSMFLVLAFIAAFGLTAPSATAATPEEIEAAIVAGLEYLAPLQNPDGSWGQYTCQRVAYTGLVLLKFEDRARELGFDDPTDPDYEYHQEVIDGLAYIVGQAVQVNITSETECDSDLDDWGYMLNNCPGDHNTYNTGIGMMALAASQRDDLYGDLLQDAADWMCYAQNNSDCGVYRGGWGYGANDCTWADNSNSGYATLGLGFAAADPPYGFDLPIPDLVKNELDLWIDYIQNDPGPADDGGEVDPDGGSGYAAPSSWVNILKTGNLLYQMFLVDGAVVTPRAEEAKDYIERHWADPGGCEEGWMDHRQAMFTMMKGFQALGIEEIDLDGDGVNETDWFDEVSTHLVATQVMPAGNWPYDCWGDETLSTAWALLTLEKVVPPPPPTCPECPPCPECPDPFDLDEWRSRINDYRQDLYDFRDALRSRFGR